VRYRQVELCGKPADRDQRVTLPVTVVHAVELAPPAGEKPVEWFVLTTLAVDSADQAMRLVAILGGYLNRKRDPPPGHQLMWQGYSTLATMGFAYALRDEIG